MNGTDRTGPPIGRVYQDAAGSFIRYRVHPGRLGRPLAEAGARKLAKEAGCRVLDVAAITEQPDGSWIVELRVEP